MPKHHGISVNTLTRLSTRRLSPYDFLAERQQTAHPVVPVHSAGEFRLFKEMLKSGGFYIASRTREPIAANVTRTIDFERFAKEWTIKVHEAAEEQRERGERIYYKLPEQLERYHKTWVKKRGEIATLANSIEMRQPITTILNNPSRQAQVLPAIELPYPAAAKPSYKKSATAKGKEKAVDYAREKSMDFESSPLFNINYG